MFSVPAAHSGLGAQREATRRRPTTPNSAQQRPTARIQPAFVDLRRAHQALDRGVDRLYRARKFSSERERVEHLFTLYERMRAPPAAATRKKPRRRRAIRVSGS